MKNVITVRLEDWSYGDIEARAANERRTVSNMTRVLIEEALEARLLKENPTGTREVSA